MQGIIAIVGRPNVGKSALFNRIAGRRIAIVHDQPGVTRDRVTAEVEWRGASFTLIDTGGIGLARGEKAVDVLVEATINQVDLAIASADLILFVVNVQEGWTPLDDDVARRLRLAGKPVLLAANKADHAGMAGGTVDFVRLGFGEGYPVSAIHGHGMDALMREAVRQLPESADSAPAGETSAPADALKLAVVGRPNVGKSSLINALTASERVIVTPVPGTTRDAVDVPFEVTVEGRREHYVLIDTAGMRKDRRVDSSVEFFSAKRTEQAIERCDIVVLVLDAEAGVTEQDKKIADRITAAARACVLVVNKWDLYQDQLKEVRRSREEGKEKVPRKRTKSRGVRDPQAAKLDQFAEWVQQKMFFLDYAPVIFTSAKSGFHLDRLLESVRYVAAQLRQKVPTAILNRTFRDAIEARQPVSATGHRLKFFYATQVESAPPTFLLFVNRDELFSAPYARYLADVVRRSFGYEGCPIRIVARPRPKSARPPRSQ